MPGVRNMLHIVYNKTNLLNICYISFINIYNSFFVGAENVEFQITASRSTEEPPSIRVMFENGVEDDIELVHYKMNEESVVGCNYLGHLKTQPSTSSVAVTGCLNNPGDRMEVTIISENNVNKMFSVDLDGHAEAIKNPFGEGGKTRIIMFWL